MSADHGVVDGMAGGRGATRTIHSALAERAAADPDRVFLRSGGEGTTYGDLLERVEDLAGRLGRLGIDAGDRVVLWLPNGAAWAQAFFACSRLGAVAVMAGTRLRAADLHHILTDSGAAALIYQPEFLGIDFDAMAAAASKGPDGRRLPGLRHVLTVGPGGIPGGRELGGLPSGPALESREDPGAAALACYTSGTTGAPKGCVHSHGALLTNATVASGLTGIGAGDRILCPVPFAHVFGFHMGVLQATISAATLINAEPFGAEHFLDLAEAEAATILYMVPAMAREVVAAQARRPRDLSAVRVTLLAGAPVSSRLRRAVIDPERGLGGELTVVYGCTEAPTLAQLERDAPRAALLSSVGRATPGVELKIVSPGGEDELPEGEPGEILARGYNTMLGYLEDDAATAAKLRGDWLATGDLGWLDGAGYLHFSGRADEMFTVGGFNVYPREIEARIEELEGVTEAAVTGVPDERLGSVPMAWVTVDDPALEESAILSWAHERMASYKRPRHARVVASLPRTASGKISRVKLRWLARRALPGLDWEDGA